MSRRTLIRNGTVISGGQCRQADILLQDGLIADDDFHGEIPPDCAVTDAAGCYVTPGFIDIHVHGGGGYDFMDGTEEAFLSVCRTHLKNGTTSILPTAVSADMDSTYRLLDLCRSAKDHCPGVLGIHLEGPYISVNQKGAHNIKYLHSPTPEETEELLSHGKGVLRRITAAPELPGMEAFAARMRKENVLLSLGHSDATSDVALAAFRNGFTHITHLYSATPSVRKINQTVMAGVVEAAYLSDDVTVELIADGKHAAQDALRLALKIKGADHVALVTDALRPAGTSVKESYLGEKKPENRVIIEDGVAKLPDRSSFAGSIATTAMLLERAVNHYGLSLPVSVQTLTETPATILGLHDRGRIGRGLRADVLVIGSDLKIRTVFAEGNRID